MNHEISSRTGISKDSLYFAHAFLAYTQGRIKSLRGPRALKNVVGVC
jgi:hypothetical protein